MVATSGLEPYKIPNKQKTNLIHTHEEYFLFFISSDVKRCVKWPKGGKRIFSRTALAKTKY